MIINIRQALAGVLCLLVPPWSQAQPPTLNLYTFPAPPFQEAQAIAAKNSRVVGETADTVTCAANRTGWATEIKITPQNWAIHSLRRNMVDGYFAVDPSAELDATARRSDPVALRKWYFFSNTADLDLTTARIGVVDGSNEHAWLTANGYPVFLSVSSAGQLPALLELDRIDTALLDQRVMEDLRAEQDLGDTAFHSSFLRYAPLYLYLSEAFTARNSAFLRHFNEFLPACMEQSLALSRQELANVRARARQLLQELNATVNLEQALINGPRLASFTDIKAIDQKWQSLAPAAATPLARQILASADSRALHAWQVKHQGLVTEVLLINDTGTLAAISQLTSDFWQGDEPKFQEVMRETPWNHFPGHDLYISPIRFDASTHHFQVTVSAPVAPQTNASPKGVITLGLDISQALRTGPAL